jgi:hypothetical protein
MATSAPAQALAVGRPLDAVDDHAVDAMGASAVGELRGSGRRCRASFTRTTSRRGRIWLEVGIAMAPDVGSKLRDATPRAPGRHPGAAEGACGRPRSRP